MKIQELIEYQGKKEDQILAKEYPFLFPTIELTLTRIPQSEDDSLNRDEEADSMMNPKPKSNFKEELSHSSNSLNDLSTTQLRKIKTIKNLNHSQDKDSSKQESEFDIIRKAPKDRRKRGSKPQGYPTKNFLPAFKTPHFTFLQRYLGYDFVNSFEVVRAIKQKSGICMKDYETLYKIPEFYDAFVQFFAERILYRELLISRSIQEVKKIHHRKLYVFEHAFETKTFVKIN